MKSLERYKADDVVRLNSPGVNTLEYYLEWLIDEAILQTDHGRHPYVDSIAPVLDAALEYWLMRHEIEHDNDGWYADRQAWYRDCGWQCSCLEDSK